MNRKLSIFVGSVLALITTAYIQHAVSSETVRNFPKATPTQENVSAKSQPAVVFSSRLKNLSLKKAYNLQKAYLKNSISKGDKVIGFKAALMDKEAAAKSGLPGPITGVLINKAILTNGSAIELGATHRLMIESELAFKFKRDFVKGMSIEEIVASIESIAPVIELPDISFAETGFNGFDIIANNAMAYKILFGEWQPMPENLDDINVSLSCDNTVLAEGSSGNVGGSQLQALKWMLDHLADKGWNVKKGHMLITGSVTEMQQAKPCDYSANFGALGMIKFKVTS